MTIISSTVGKNPYKKWSSTHSQQESEIRYLSAVSKKDKMISVHFQGKAFNMTIIQVFAPTSNAEDAEFEWFYDDLREKAMAPNSSTLAWKIPWTEETGRLQS